MTIEVRCAGCCQQFLVEDAEVGSELACPHCTMPLVVPAVAPVEPPAPPPAHADGDTDTGRDIVVCPRCQLHFSAAGHAAGAEGDDRRPRVLIVEDMSYFRKIAEEALISEYDVETATSVEDARAALDRGAVDLLVLDLSLQDHDDGLSLLRDSVLKPCPVLIFTARDESEMYGDEWEELRRLGADDVVIKGMNVAESLRRKVGSLLGRTWRDEESRPD